MTWLETSISEDGTVFRDLNGNGMMDPYENPRLGVDVRVRDLISRMTLAEKVGLMFQSPLQMSPDGSLLEERGLLGGPPTSDLVCERHMRHFNLMFMPPQVGNVALWANRLQKLAEGTRLGIPVLISSDPCHGGAGVFGVSVLSEHFSTWPTEAGLGALRDPRAIQEFAEIAREEYSAIGLRAALHPQVDLATEPRWARLECSFGLDADLVSEYVRAYLLGFQGTRGASQPLNSSSVACMTKHFPGGGPQKDGEDPHFPYGREQIYPSMHFDYHLEPFRAAIESGTAAIMPYYGMPVGLRRNGKDIEEVGFAFNKQIITDLLREELGYDGVVCTDWQLVTDTVFAGHEESIRARAWGVESLDRPSRVQRIVDAGCDQLGGEYCTEVLVALVEQNRISEARIDESVERLLRVIFELGLFDDPFVDESAVTAKVGTEEGVAKGFAAQVGSLVLLQDRGVPDHLLPLQTDTKAYIEGGDAAPFENRLHVVSKLEDADVIIVRLETPWTPRDQEVLDPFIRAGTLEFSDDVITRLWELSEHAPLIVDVHLSRGAAVTPLVDVSTVLIGSFSSSSEALGVGLTTEGALTGLMPFDLPRSDRDAADHAPDDPSGLRAVFEADYSAPRRVRNCR